MARAERRLAAIMAADIVGYSRLVEQDEAGTLAAVRALRQELIEPLLAVHHGRIVKLMGDGAIAEFASVVEAVDCAVAVQRGAAARQAEVPAEQRILFRIGVNLGDVVVEGDGDLLGDGVNVAARLERLCEPGGVLVSGTAYDHLQGKLDLPLECAGEQRVKNIERPVRVYRMRPDAEASDARRRPRLWTLVAAMAALAPVALAGFGGLWWRAGIDTRAVDPVLAIPAGPTIAVLPFANLSGDPEQAYLSEGMAEEITTALSRFREVRVLGRNVTAPREDRRPGIDALREQLGVDWAVQGSLRRAGDMVRITAQLLDVRSGVQVWSESFDRRLTPANLFELQDEIASKVGAAIGDATGGAIALRRLEDARARAPAELTAYQCFLAANEVVTRVRLTGLEEARACLERTVRQEPGYADAWATLAALYSIIWTQDLNRGQWGSWDPRRATLEAARRAVELAPGSARAHVAMARAALFTGDVDRFNAEAEMALALNPNDALALGNLGNYIAFSGRWERGVALARKAIALLPASHPRWWWFAEAKEHFRKGEYAEALVFFKRADSPGWWLNQLTYAYTYGQMGDREAAAQAVAELQRLRPGYSIADAVAFYRKFGFQPSYIERMTEGLQKAGLPDAPAS